MTQEEITNQIDKISKQLNIENIKSTMKTEDLLFSLYNKESKRIANMLMAGDVSFGDLNEITAKLDVIKKRLDDKATKAISKSINISLKNSMNDVRSQITVFKNVLPKEIVDSEIRPEVFRQVFFEAVEAMRILDDGLELSEKIWDINQKALDDIRLYMMEAMINDVSFGEIYHQIKSFLLLSDVDMRTKKWRQFFKEHPPGRGVYRSAFKNVMRVLRTETNRAFRLGTVKYAQNRTWVYGLQFVLSLAHPEPDICCTGDTIVIADKKHIKIKDVKKGMKVITHNNKYRKVTKTYKRKLKYAELIRIDYVSLHQRYNNLVVTTNHPVLVKNKGWVRAELLKKGMILPALYIFPEVEILDVSRMVMDNIYVYNLEVEEDNSYCANNIFIHNCDEYATQDVDGLGSGIYYPANIPTSPHCHCLCHIKIVPRFDILNIEGLGL